MIGLPQLYVAVGLVFAAFAAIRLIEEPRRADNALLYALIAASFLLGDRIGDLGNGVLVLAIVAAATLGRTRPTSATDDAPTPRGMMLFGLALIIPLIAVAGTLVFRPFPALVDPKQATLVALVLGVIVALTVCQWLLRPPLLQPFREGARLMDHIGWAAILPQMLASLGAVFALAGVGREVGALVGGAIPHGSVLGAVIVYATGMALFTIVMGNAFAAFPVMFTAIGMPLLVTTYHGAPAPIAAIGMLAGFCGTLVTPMAANFNLVPAALLELKDRYGVIRAQLPTALPLLLFNIALLWWVMP